MANEVDELERLIALYGNSIEGKLWRGSHSRHDSHNNQKSIDTGYESLNQQLHSNGWPLGTTTEFGISTHGIGELRLLLPALVLPTLKGSKHSPQIEYSPPPRLRQLVLIAPPYLPFAPALLKHGVKLNDLTVIQTNTLKDSLWAVEQSLAANCCNAVICWTGKQKINTHDLRRLQLAAEKTQSWSVLFRHSDCLKEASASGLRIQLNSNIYSKLELNILKQPNGWGGQKCTVSLSPHYENWQRLPVNLLPVHKPIQQQIRHAKSAALAIKKTAKRKDITQAKAWHSGVTIISALSKLRTVR